MPGEFSSPLTDSTDGATLLSKLLAQTN